MKMIILIICLVSLLSSARNQRNSSLSEQIYHRIEKIFPNYKKELIPAVILLANTYQSSGNFEKATFIKNKLNVEGAKKQQGLTWTEVNGKIFVSQNIFHLFNKYLFRNLVLMIDLILKHWKFILNSIEYEMNLFNMVINLIQLPILEY